MNKTLLILTLVIGLAGCAATPEQKQERNRYREAAQLNVQLGMSYLERGQLEVANAKLQRALQLDPGLADAHHAHALLQERLGEDEKAEAAYREALRLAPKSAEAHNNFGSFLCRRNRIDEAVAEFDRALENPLYSTPEFAHSNAGICLLRKPDEAAAEARFKQALRFKPGFPPALLQLAALAQKRQQPAVVRDTIQQFHKHSPQTPDSLWLAAWAAHALADGDALRTYRLLLKGKYPDSPQARRLEELVSHD